jgi:hypothetical protein
MSFLNGGYGSFQPMPLLTTLNRLNIMHKRKLIVMAVLAAFVVLGVAAMKAPFQKARNLKVLPKDISDAKLDSIMQTYNIALGVSVIFVMYP